MRFMDFGFDHKTLREDLTMAKNAVFGFLKSFGPAPRQAGFAEDQKMRFMLSLVEMGPLKIIKTIMLVIVGLFLLLVIFIHADAFFKVVSVAAFIIFYGWLFSGEIAETVKKAGDKITINQGLAKLNQVLKFVEGEKPKDAPKK